MLSVARSERRAALILNGIRLTVAIGWASVAYVVLALEPEAPLHVAALLVAFAVATGGTVAMIAHGLSFRVFADRAFRGNAGLCAMQGIAAGAALSLALGLQIARFPLWLVLAVGAGAFAAGQVAVLLRARGKT